MSRRAMRRMVTSMVVFTICATAYNLVFSLVRIYQGYELAAVIHAVGGIMAVVGLEVAVRDHKLIKWFESLEGEDP